MARTRSLSPTAPVDEDVATMSLAARYVWAYLPCHADREGRLRDSPFTLKTAIMPADNVDMDAILSELADKRHIVRYESDGRKYIQIRSFSKYQWPHHKEKPSEIPAPGKPKASPRPVREKTKTSLPEIGSGSGTPENGKRITDNGEVTAEASLPTARDFIAAFCEEWPEAYPGERYQVSLADQGQAKKLAAEKTIGLVAFRAAAKRYVRSDKPFYASSRHPLRMLTGNLNEFMGDPRALGPPNGTSRIDRKFDEHQQSFQQGREWAEGK